MASYVFYPGDGVQTDWSVPFPYLAAAHVKAYTLGGPVFLTWLNAALVRVTPAIAPGQTLLVQRETPKEPLTQFVNTNNLTAENLTLAELQALYIAEEARDRAEQSIVIDEANGQYNFGNRRSTNMADPVNAQDGVNKRWAETAMSSQLAIATGAAATSTNNANTTTADRAAVASDKSTISGWKDTISGWKDTIEGWKDTIQGWYNGVNVWQAQVSSDKAATQAALSAAESARNTATAAASTSTTNRDATAADRTAVAADKTTISGWKDTIEGWKTSVQGWYNSVNTWQATVNTQRNEVSTWHTTISGWKDTIEGWKNSVQSWYNSVNTWQAQVSTNKDAAAASATAAAQSAADAAAAAGSVNPSEVLLKGGNLAGIADKAVARSNIGAQADLGLAGGTSVWTSANFDPANYQTKLSYTPANKAGDTFTGPVTFTQRPTFSANLIYLDAAQTKYLYWYAAGGYYSLAGGHLYTDAGRLWGTNDFSSPWTISNVNPLSNMRMVHAGDQFGYAAWEPWSGIVVTGIGADTAGAVSQVRFRYLQMYFANSGWATVGYS